MQSFGQDAAAPGLSPAPLRATMWGMTVTEHPPPTRATRGLTPSYRIESDLYARFVKIAKAQGASASSLTRLLIEQHVEQHEAQP